MRCLFSILIWSALTAACFADSSLERLGGSLFHPWGLSLLNENQVLVTERRGKIFRINLTDGQRYEIGNVPKTVSKKQGVA
jgi:glucose/arabinose dehydrogenase